jgi:hypothetical protein
MTGRLCVAKASKIWRTGTSIVTLSPRKLCAAGCAKAVSSKPYGRSHEAILKQTGPSFHQVDRGSHVMWTIINALYEEYCQARLDEMLRIDAVK